VKTQSVLIAQTGVNQNAGNGRKRESVKIGTFLINVNWPVTQNATPPVSMIAKKHALTGQKMDYARRRPGSMIIVKNHVIQHAGPPLHHQLHQQQPLIALTTASQHARIGSTTNHGICAATHCSLKHVQKSVIQIAQVLLTALTQTPAAAVMVNLDNVRLRGNALNGAMFLTG